MAARATSVDLAIALGGDANVAMLLDKDGDGVADTVWITTLLGWASAEIDGRIRRQIPVEQLAAPYPLSLVRHEAMIAAYLAWLHAPGGLAMPDNIRRGYEDAIAWADQVGDKRITLDGATEAPHQAPDALVDINPTGRRITRRSMGGFC